MKAKLLFLYKLCYSFRRYLYPLPVETYASIKFPGLIYHILKYIFLTPTQV